MCGRGSRDIGVRCEQRQTAFSRCVTTISLAVLLLPLLLLLLLLRFLRAPSLQLTHGDSCSIYEACNS